MPGRVFCNLYLCRSHVTARRFTPPSTPTRRASFIRSNRLLMRNYGNKRFALHQDGKRVIVSPKRRNQSNNTKKRKPETRVFHTNTPIFYSFPFPLGPLLLTFMKKGTRCSPLLPPPLHAFGLNNMAKKNVLTSISFCKQSHQFPLIPGHVIFLPPFFFFFVFFFKRCIIAHLMR